MAPVVNTDGCLKMVIKNNKENNMENNQIQYYCYKDMRGDAEQIVHLILNAYSQANFNYNNCDLFSHISEDELNNRYFKNIDWDSIIKIAISAKSRQETYNYLSRI